MGSFIFVRHGESEANAARIIATPESPLSRKGKAQAKETAKRVQSLLINKIISSPYIRCKQTAEIIATELGLSPEEIIYIKDLGERSGPAIEGKPKQHQNDWYFLNDDPREESRLDLTLRMTRALKEIQELIKQHDRALVVGHAVSGFYLMQVAKGKLRFQDFDPPSQMLNADYIKVELSEP